VVQDVGQLLVERRPEQGLEVLGQASHSCHVLGAGMRSSLLEMVRPGAVSPALVPTSASAAVGYVSSCAGGARYTELGELM
jgi:hypothetical protein